LPWNQQNVDASAAIAQEGYGTADALVSIGYTSAETRETWAGTFDSVSMYQSVADEDFDVYVKCEGSIVGTSQEWGMLAWESDNNAVGISFYDSAGALKIWKGNILGGEGATTTPTEITTTPYYIRMTYVESTETFTMWYSQIGGTFPDNWFQAGSPLVHTLVPSRLYLWVGSSASVAHTQTLDYFFEAAAVISPEDPVGGRRVMVVT
jgi:hypothetical protein